MGRNSVPDWGSRAAFSCQWRSVTCALRREATRRGLPRLGARLDGLTVAQLSDLHFGPYTGEAEIRRAIAAVNAASPDLIVLTGDFVSSTWLFHLGHRTGREIVPCAELLRELRCPFGVYAILGNHDWGVGPDFIAGTLSEAGIRVLRNQAVAVERGGGRLWLAGVDDALYKAVDINRALARVPAGEPVLLLAHEPDFADEAARYPVSVQLSGHAHGGQIVLPGVGAPYLPPLGRKYRCGLYAVRNMCLYSNRGVGVAGVPVRFGAPPEVALVGFRSGAASASLVSASDMAVAAAGLRPATT
jgi:hypothetical protein